MATYKSLVEFNGKIDGLVFYTLNGKPVVRRKSGFSKEAYRDDPKYAKVRENSSEFGHASKSGKMLRQELSPYLQHTGDKYLYQKFAQLMTQIKDLDAVSGRGKRKIEAGMKDPASVELLKNFKFGEVENLKNFAVRSEGLFSVPIQLKNMQGIDSIELITLHPNFTLYSSESKTQKFPVAGKQLSYDFEKFFDEAEAPALLYFLVLKKGENILKMGFV